jgi:hypothetical protein
MSPVLAGEDALQGGVGGDLGGAAEREMGPLLPVLGTCIHRAVAVILGLWSLDSEFHSENPNLKSSRVGESFRISICID